ncbi:MAG TPA: NUDIX domain-containing protein [Dehalococcoidales bacterium]|nr:NUDIX domain-containing protein [Dehalococcoidales bacterium]
MKHRIRAAAIIVKGDSVLLVRHKFPDSDPWVPPGGGVEDSESVYDCAKRETYEETGLTVELGKILYLREFIEPSRAVHQFEIFIFATSFTGEPTLTNNSPDDPDFKYIKDVKFVSKKDMEGLLIYPEELKDKFWRDMAAGKLETQYLGQKFG